jgi:hypothetical protein
VVPDDPKADTISINSAVLGGGSCALPCPLFMIEDESYTHMLNWFLALLVLSTIGVCFLFATFSFFPQKRRNYVAHSVLFTLVRVLLVSFFSWFALKTLYNP